MPCLGWCRPTAWTPLVRQPRACRPAAARCCESAPTTPRLAAQQPRLQLSLQGKVQSISQPAPTPPLPLKTAPTRPSPCPPSHDALLHGHCHGPCQRVDGLAPLPLGRSVLHAGRTGVLRGGCMQGGREVVGADGLGWVGLGR